MEFREIVALVREAQRLPEGRARTALIEEAVRGADVLGDVDLQFAVRIEFIQAAFWSDEPHKLIAAVAWCQGTFDREPERFSGDNLVFALSNAIICASSMPQVSREQIERMFVDVGRRSEALNHHPYDLHRLRAFCAMWMGDHVAAREHFARMLSAGLPRDASEPWARLFRADFHLQTGDEDAALREAEPILRAAGDSAGVFPWLASFLLPVLARRGSRWRAARLQRRAYPAIKDNPKHIELIAHHLHYFSLVGKIAPALELLERHLPWALESFPHRELLEFHVAAARLCREAAARGAAALRLPPGFPDAKLRASGSVTDLGHWCRLQADELAAAFDRRNGNTYFAELVARRSE